MVMTRKIDKVGDTSAITEMVGESGDRACEAIKVYARGVNPMVAVSYNNYGNEGGTSVNGIPSTSSKRRGQQARLPYSLGPNGSFRPPVIPPQNLYPLSRLPRVWTSSFTNPGFTDFSKKVTCEGGCYRQIKKDTLKTCVRPTAIFRLEAPIKENFKAENAIQDITKVAGTSGMRSRDFTTQDVKTPTRGFQDPIYAQAKSNISRNIHVTPIEDLFDGNIRTKENFSIPYVTNLKGYEKDNREYEDINLERTLPMYHTQSNTSKNVYINPVQNTQYLKDYKVNRPSTMATSNIRKNGGEQIMSRDYNLPPMIQKGGFVGKPSIPMKYRENNFTVNESYKQELNRKVSDMYQGRFSHPFGEK